jgi:endonuclease/exonuclease/phosphatase family metal-dependent hydrolase
MSTKIRIATFNLENLDDKPGQSPTIEERILLMRPQLLRLNADILCLQEVNGQEQPGLPRQLLALNKLLSGTPYSTYHRASTLTLGSPQQVYDERNLVILSRFEILEALQHKPDGTPFYKKVTSVPPDTQAKEILWERPLLYARLKLSDTQSLHVFNLHLKSKMPSSIPGQQLNEYTWKTCYGWAEGSFISTMKRVGQAIQLRRLIDGLFDVHPEAWMAICGDFNAEVEEIEMQAIRGDVENTNNATLAGRVLVACERTVPESSRFTLYHHGRGVMLDHILVSRPLLGFYRGTEIHNELLHDESMAFASDRTYPESDHAPVIAEFEIPETSIT